MNCFFCSGILARMRVYLYFSFLLFSFLFFSGFPSGIPRCFLIDLETQKRQPLLAVLFLIFFIVFTSHVTVYHIKHKYIFKQLFVTVLKIQFYFIIFSRFVKLLFKSTAYNVPQNLYALYMRFRCPSRTLLLYHR